MKKLIYAFAVALIGTASAAQAAPTRIRGVISAVRGNVLTIKSRDGDQVTLNLAPNYTVGTVGRATLGDIKPNDFVGATTIPRRDGTLVALEVHIFPPAKRGAGEGSRPWDLAPHSMMTNADVTGAVTTKGGRKLTLTYNGGQKTILVTPRTPIVFLLSGTQADVKPGVGVTAVAQKNPDGSYQADRITVGRDGVNPAD